MMAYAGCALFRITAVFLILISISPKKDEISSKFIKGNNNQAMM